MTSILSLRKRRAELIRDAEKLANKSDFNEKTDGKKIDKYLSDVEVIDKKIADLEKSAKRKSKLAAASKSLGDAQPRRSSGNVVVTGHASKRDPKRGFHTPREFLMAIMDHSQTNRLDERLASLRPSSMGWKELAAGSDEHGEYADPYGGFLVPEGFAPDMLRIDPEMDPMGSLTRKIPMQNPILNINARVDANHSSSVSGGLTVARREETSAATSSRMERKKVALHAHSLFGLAYVTEELLVDSPVSFAALLAEGFSEEFTSAIINERINGTGVGEFLGVLNAGCLVSVAKETGQAATTLVYENVVNMRSRCWGYSNAVWIANHDTLPQLMLLNQSVGTGGAIVWQPSAREDHPDLLLGRPLIFTEYAKTLGTKGDLILGNWREYLEGQLQPLQSAESVHVRFINHERTFKFWLRNAGTPWWDSALTPKNGSNTLSPFVTVDTRS